MPRPAPYSAWASEFHLTPINLFSSPTTLRDQLHSYAHFTDEETEAKRLLWRLFLQSRSQLPSTHLPLKAPVGKPFLTNPSHFGQPDHPPSPSPGNPSSGSPTSAPSEDRVPLLGPCLSSKPELSLSQSAISLHRTQGQSWPCLPVLASCMHCSNST